MSIGGIRKTFSVKNVYVVHKRLRLLTSGRNHPEKTLLSPPPHFCGGDLSVCCRSKYTDRVAETCSSSVCVYAVHYITFRIGKKSEHSHILPTLASQ